MAGFRTQHIATVPKGWKVKTVTHPSGHEARIAFPPGARKKGSGRLVEILHPNREKNPEPGCIEIYDLAVGHAGVPEPGSPSAIGISKGIGEVAGAPFQVSSNPKEKTKTREQLEKMQAKAVRFLRDVVGDSDKADEIDDMTPEEYADKKRVHLVNKRSVRKTLSKVKEKVKRALHINKSKKRCNKRPRRNLDEIPEVQRLYETFQGHPAKVMTELDEPDARRDDFAHLGWLVDLVIQPYGDALEGIADPNDLSDEEKSLRDSSPDMSQRAVWQQLAEDFGVVYVVLDFSGGQKIPETTAFKKYGDGVIVAGAASGNSIYFLGGNQDVSGLLDRFKVDASKDRVALGVLVALTYLAAKSIPDEPEIDKKPIAWQHILGEEGGDPPLVFYDKLQKRLFLAGGNYSIEAPGITN
ncbi:MAG: hypothetical protein ABSF73_03040 [Terriglobia bacterium]|jgi:hypothetical protein